MSKPSWGGSTARFPILVALLGLGVVACNDAQEPTHQVALSEVIPQPDTDPQWESAHLALSFCATDADCFPAPSCREPRCVAGECRYVRNDLLCCTADVDCESIDTCLAGHCQVAPGASSGQCDFEADPLKPGCCHTADDCKQPAGPYVAVCVPKPGTNYSVCSQTADPEVCQIPSGAIVINEFMVNPNAANESTGEWIELFNPGLQDVDLRHWVLRDEESDVISIQGASPLIISAGGYFVLARSDNPQNNGFLYPDYVYSSMILGNGIDEIILLDKDGEEVDRVSYEAPIFPIADGASLELINPYLDNQEGVNWKPAQKVTSPYLDKGTPGGPNTDVFFTYYTPPVCDDKNACTLDVCGTGTDPRCKHLPIRDCCLFNQECDDGDACTEDICEGESLVCQHSRIPLCCLDDTYCNDNNSCTVDACVNKQCRFMASPLKPNCCLTDAECKDINLCSIDYCAMDPGGPYKTCHHTFPGGAKCCQIHSDCNDNKVETIDTCVNYYCQYGPNPKFCLGPPPQYCNDNDVCTLDLCNLNTFLCEHQDIQGCCKKNLDCSDGDPCTDDFCQLAVHTCTHIPRLGCCHDNQDCEQFVTDKDMCREPVCLDNSCRMVHIPSEGCCLTKSDCDDNNSCTTDSCDPGTNLCQHKSVGQSCCNRASDCNEDDDPCTQAQCVASQCTFKTVAGCCKSDFQCDDGSLCTSDICEEYRCRFVFTPDAGCCDSEADCPMPPSACFQRSCGADHACVLIPILPCLVKPNWYERFSSGFTLSELGWEAAPSPVGGFQTQWGSDVPLGPDGVAVLMADSSIQGGTACLSSPYVDAGSGASALTLTWEQWMKADLSATQGALAFSVEAQSLGIEQTVPLALFVQPLAQTAPFMVSIPQKLLTAPFRLRFCATVPQGAKDVVWAVDSIKVGRGAPPRFQQELVDLALTPGQAELQNLSVEDSDGDNLQFYLVGPSHVKLKGVASKGPGKAVATLLFAPLTAIDLGRHEVSVEVTDGFFLDRRTMTEIAYIPKCTFDSDCDDSNNCTVEKCNPIDGCSHQYIDGCCNGSTLCNDENYCTVDSCVEGVCQYVDLNCDDGNICTLDQCNPQVGCQHPFALVECDDGNACTWHDLCLQGTCMGVQVDCNDGLGCTLDSCNIVTGCQNKSLCSDSVFCTMDMCTSKGCKSGKAPVGVPQLDGVASSDWLASAASPVAGPLFSAFLWMQDEAGLYMAVRSQVSAGQGVVIFLDKDFTKSTGVSQLKLVKPGSTGLASMLAPQLDVVFPGFGADMAVVAYWGADAPPSLPTVTGCYLVSATDIPTLKPCQISVGPDATVEVSIPWSTLYGAAGPAGRSVAAIAVRPSSSGDVLESIPASLAGVATDVRLSGAVDLTCLVPVCGDGVPDSGEECDEGAQNSNFQSNRCRTNCVNFSCGDGVQDGGEQCDMGIYNSNETANACRKNCLTAHCGDGVKDTAEECDLGALNSDVLANTCRTTCKNPYCGDGAVDAGEGCDQGVLNHDTLPDRCRKDCTPPYCGDGVQDTGEQCDMGIYNSDLEPNKCRLDCYSPHCGDAVLDFGEQCDKGVSNDSVTPDWCRPNCKNAYCGDGVVDSFEQCDDGNNIDWDGCQANCSIYVTQCGDAIHTPDEECDNGPANSNTAPNACRTNCKKAGCGDNVIDNGEVCDDGNLLGGDACGADCKPYVAGCGSNWVDPGEECDHGLLNSNTAPDACRLDCTNPRCGDLVIDTMEECDKGAANSDVTPNACRLNCLKARCGDSVTDSGEQCDQGPLNADLPDRCKTNCVAPRCGDNIVDSVMGESCDQGVYNSDTLPGACRTNCLPARCGDNVVDNGEVCDQGLNNSDTLPNRCRTNCLPARCGDGTTDSSEQCDQGLSNSNTAPDTCRVNCLLPRCGDTVVDVLKGETCDLGSSNSDTLPNTCRISCQVPSCGDNVIDSGEVCDDGNTLSHDGCTPLCQIEIYTPEPGDILITEIMNYPKAGVVGSQEWFEIYNTRDYQIDVNGWMVFDDNDEQHVINNGGHLWVPAHGYLVLGVLANAGAHNVAYHYPLADLLLGNAADALMLSFNDVIVDEVHWDNGPSFPDTFGASMSLDPGRFDVNLNDLGSNWCTAFTLMADGDFGTPGGPNPKCP